MPRQARLDNLGALHHIMVRGINRSQIFDDDEDRFRFLTRLGENILETSPPSMPGCSWKRTYYRR
ncbi:MAG: hypothetical protein FJ117_20405 [Deltaproteobacteria bacterium]|nr:hypothetical protein [Deltaproteobacteria bacterium]